MNRFLVLLFFIFQTPILQASDCKGSFQKSRKNFLKSIEGKSTEEITNALFKEIKRFEVNLDNVKILIDYGANVHAINNSGHTALMLAAIRGHKGVVRILIENGASLDTRNEVAGGWRAITYATSIGHKGVVRILIEDGADVNLLETAIAKKMDHKEISRMFKERERK